MDLELVGHKDLTQQQRRQIVTIGAENFSGLRRDAWLWVQANLSAYPRMQYFGAWSPRYDQLVGYILWTEHGGFRPEAVIELEQIAVAKAFQSQGVGKWLIQNSFAKIQNFIVWAGRRLKLVMITTGAENRAQRLYQETLGAKVEVTIPDLYRGDEVIMIRRF